MRAVFLPVAALLLLLSLVLFRLIEPEEELYSTSTTGSQPNTSSPDKSLQVTRSDNLSTDAVTSVPLVLKFHPSDDTKGDAAGTWARARRELAGQLADLGPNELFLAIEALNRNAPRNSAEQVARAYSLGYLAWAVHLEPKFKTEAIQILHRALQDVSDPFYQGYAFFALYGLHDDAISFRVASSEFASTAIMTPDPPIRVVGEWVADSPVPPIDPEGTAADDLIKDLLVRFAVGSDDGGVNSTTRLLALQALALVDHQVFGEVLDRLELTQWGNTLAEALGREGSPEAVRALRRWEETEIRQGALLPSVSHNLIAIGEYSADVGNAAFALIQDPDPAHGYDAAKYLSAALRSRSASQVKPLVEQALKLDLTPLALEAICKGIRSASDETFIAALRAQLQRSDGGFRREALSYALEGIDPEWNSPPSLFTQLDQIQSQIDHLQGDPTRHDKPNVGLMISALVKQKRALEEVLTDMREAERKR